MAIFDTEGNMLCRFAANSSNGPLQAPWELVLAPDNFGWASHKLLIGGVDSGQISVFNLETGEYLGALSDVHGNPLVIDSVWAPIFAREDRDDSSPQLYFAAGCAFPPAYSPSLFGVIKMADDGDDGKSGTGNAALPVARPRSRVSTREN